MAEADFNPLDLKKLTDDEQKCVKGIFGLADIKE